MIARPISSAGFSLASAHAAAQIASAWDARRWSAASSADLAGWLLITQPDHAALSGEFARHWGNELFAAPALRNDLAAAIAHHDDGWQEADAEPRWFRATRAPQNFLDLAPDDFTSISRRSIRFAGARSSLAGYLVSWHFRKLAEARSAVDSAFAALPQIQEFLADQRSLQAELRPHFAALPDVAVSEACRLLQFSDMLSIYICLGALDDCTFPQEFLTGSNSRARVTLHFEPEATLWLSPYPFDCSPLSLRVTGRRLDQASFRNQEELSHAYASAPPETLSVEFRAP